VYLMKLSVSATSVGVDTKGRAQCLLLMNMSGGLLSSVLFVSAEAIELEGHHWQVLQHKRQAQVLSSRLKNCRHSRPCHQFKEVQLSPTNDTDKHRGLLTPCHATCMKPWKAFATALEAEELLVCSVTQLIFVTLSHFYLCEGQTESLGAVA